MVDILQYDILIPFCAILLIVAFLYSSVGHGGASGYLALMALFGFSNIVMKPTALLLNIFVAGVSFLIFRKREYFKWKLFYPFAITSIPAAFIGGYIQVTSSLYKYVLGVFLVLAILRMLVNLKRDESELRDNHLLLSLFFGGVIGLFSGMIGIGGGIILSPIIILLGWGTVKESAAVSALFIFVNSLAGIIGFSINGGSIPITAWYFIPAAILGGSLGAFYGSGKVSTRVLTYLLATVLFVAAMKLFFV